MNVIFLLCDTLVREKLSAYNNGDGPYAPIRTPNISRLAERSTTFTNHWVNSAPCMPARRDLWSGRMEFPWRSWGPKETFDPDWSRTCYHSNVNTSLFTDHANLFDVGAGNYHFFFDTYTLVRGHYNDHCLTSIPAAPGRCDGHWYATYAAHRETWKTEEDAFVARNLSNAAQWLDDHGTDRQPFFMCIDEFDPHWPLDPPEPYRSMYLDDKSLVDKKLSTHYHGGGIENYDPDEIAWLKAQCAGKITMVDRWLGEIFDRLDKHDLWDDTAVILTTDHGEFIGEYGQMSKGNGFDYPLFSRIPLIIHWPGSPHAGTKNDNLSCAVDIHATVLDMLEQPISEHCHGQSLLPILNGAPQQVRTDVLHGWWGRGFYWTDGKYLLCKAPESEGPLYQYGTDFGEKWVGIKKDYFDRYADAEVGRFMPHTERPVYRVPMNGLAYANPHADFDALFDLTEDPECAHNLYQERGKTTTADCLDRLVTEMKRIQVPEEHFKRLGLHRSRSSSC